jgi:hypothetical protein
LLLLLLTGCERHFFQPHGDLVLDDGPFGSWHGPVQGCIRAPADALGPPQAKTIVSFVWIKPANDDLRTQRHLPQYNAPVELDVARRQQGELTGTLATDYTPLGDPLDSRSCRTLSLTTEDGPPELAGGRPTLGGTLDLDCTIRSAHVTAHIQFSGCEY